MSLRHRIRAGAIIARASIRHFERPDRLPRALRAMAPWGASIAGLAAGAAARYPDEVAVCDDDESLTNRQLWERAQSVAADLAELGVGRGSCVGLLCRNHVGFVEWTIAVAATGADLVLLNTGFAAPQLADVVEHEHIELVIHDDEFVSVVSGCGAARLLDETAMAGMATSGGTVEPTDEPGRVVILTSGTTGRPKGAARRSDPDAADGVAALFERIPLRVLDTQVIAAPLFHAWGFSHLLLGLARCATNIVTRRFDAETTISEVSRHRARVLVVVPVMLQRILALGPDRLEHHPTPNLKVIAASGSALGSRLTVDVMNQFGPVLYNLYGSTEVAAATIATPTDLAVAPSTAGRPAFGVDVEILDDAGNPVPDGEKGRIFVGGSLRFEGYTNGETKEEQRGMLSTGDVGYFRNGMLFVEGRDDDMIVSGGENVFPIEVEELLSHHPSIADVAIVGVPDDEFGQALAAFVVPQPGADEPITAEAVRSHVKEHLARHKVPRQVHVVDELPRTTTGKILRRDLGRQADPDSAG